MSSTPHSAQYDGHIAITQSLRENLIPMSRWFQSVNDVEAKGPVQLVHILDNHSLNSLAFTYTVPYPYKTPVYAEMIRQKYKDQNQIDLNKVNEFTENDYNAWFQYLNARIVPFIERKVHDDFISYIDSNYDLGVILHRTQGIIFPFSYADVEAFQIYSVPVAFTFMILKYANKISEIAPNQQEYLRILSTLYANRDKYDMWYAPQYRTEHGDEFFDPGAMNCITSVMSYNAQDTSDITNYILTMFNRHAKCLIIP